MRRRVRDSRQWARTPRNDATVVARESVGERGTEDATQEFFVKTVHNNKICHQLMIRGMGCTNLTCKLTLFQSSKTDTKKQEQ